MKKRYIGAGVILAAILGAGTFTWSPLPSNPSAAELSKAAQDYNATVMRDDFGVPHIFGVRDADASFGLAYAHAEDDFETIQLTIAATRGHLARYQGKDAAVTDYLVQLMGIWDTIEENRANIPSDVIAIAEAYVAGLNLYAAENPDATWVGLAPFTSDDVFAGFMFKSPFFYGLDSELLALFGDERNAQVALDPSGSKGAFQTGPRDTAERGSNGFAIAPARSVDGKTRLLINSHQPLTGPVAWYEAHIVSEQGLDMQGGLFPGTPVILCGFNRNIGWANTVNNPDLFDSFVLTVNPDNPDQYWLDGAWVDFDITPVTIDVKLLGPFAFKARREIKRSIHGPVIEASHGTYAVKYAGLGEYRQLEQYYRLNKTTGMDSFLDVMSQNALPSINYVVADKDGNVGLVYNGQMPDRAPGWAWDADLPGDRSDIIWDQYRPFDDVPKLINPSSGLIWNANNDPAFATDGPDNLRRAEMIVEMGLQDNMTNRAMRLTELFDGQTPISRDSLLAVKFDDDYSTGSIAARVMAEILRADFSDDPQLKAAQDVLSRWDLSADAPNISAALGVLTVRPAVTEKYTKIPSPEPVEALRLARDFLIAEHGRLDVPWGEVNRMIRGEVNAPLSGGPDTLRAVYTARVDGTGQHKMTTGDTYIALVEWPAPDSANNAAPRASVIHQFGSKTLGEDSPHYDDQAKIFARGEFREALWDREEIEAKATRIYRPGKPK